MLSLCFCFLVAALPSQALRSPRPGCGTQRLLRCRLHPAGRCPNSSSLFPPLAAVVAVAPKGGASGVPVRFTLGEQSLLYPKTAVPCYRGQQLRDNIPCQAAVNLCSRALSFYVISGFRRPAQCCPTCQWCFAPGLRLPASASLSLASCWPRPQQLLPVSATGGGRRRCPLWESCHRR